MEKSIENDESSYVLALSVLLLELAIPMIILVLIAFVFDIILFPLEIIIYLKIKKVRNEKSVKEFQPTYKINPKAIGIKAYKYNKKSKEWECISERNK